MSGIVSAGEVARRLRAFDKLRVKSQKNALREEMKSARKRASDRFKKTSPGRSIFKRSRRAGPRKPKMTLKTIRIRESRSVGGLVGGLELLGFLALIETGGRTRPHTIPSKGKLLRFTPRGARQEIFATKVEHKGGRVKKAPHGQRELKKAAQNLPKLTDAKFRQALMAVKLD